MMLPNLSPEPTVISAAVPIHAMSRHWGSFSRSGIVMARGLLLSTLLLLVAGCAHLSDADIRKNLAGTWQVTPSVIPQRIKMIYTIAPNGDFTRETLMSTAGVRGIDMTGTLQIQDSYLIQTITYMRVRRNAHLPPVLRAKIIHADNSKMAVVFDGTTEKETFRKDTR